jgi:hypothetical protein
VKLSIKHFLHYYSISLKTKTTTKNCSAPDSKQSPVSILPLARQSFTPIYKTARVYFLSLFLWEGGGGHFSGVWKESEELTMF